MDKLELDERVARLEQKVSVLSAVLLGGLMLFGISAAFLLTARAEIRPPATAATIVATPAPMAPAPMAGPVDFSEGGVGYLANQLRQMAELHATKLLDDAEFQAKKEQLLAKPLTSSNLKAELELLAGLKDERVLDEGEYQAVRAKVLQLGK